MTFSTQNQIRTSVFETLKDPVPVMGVDPGVRGGLSVFDKSGAPCIVTSFRPEMREADLLSAVTAAVHILLDRGGYACMMEKVGYMRGDGGKGAFTFGKIYGLLRGILLLSGVRIHDVQPVVWQTRMGCLTGGDKNVSKNRALELFPEVDEVKKITHATADALLIGKYGWMVLNGRVR